MALDSVVGRERELETIASFLELETPGGRVLVLEGEAGIGKTTLWRAGVDAGRELSHVVLHASPAEKEAMFAYSVVSDLLEEVLDDVLTELPEPQRRALEVALLRRASDGTPPEQHTLGVALLAVLRTLAASGPVLLAVDDVQWLDPSSSAMLEFATRRLRDERLALLVSRRQESPSAAGRLELAMPEERRLVFRVGPLSMGALHRLLRDRLGTTLARPALRRVHDASGGNPFYALELVRALESSGGPNPAGPSVARAADARGDPPRAHRRAARRRP
jgi:predicted ATPase